MFRNARTKLLSVGICAVAIGAVATMGLGSAGAAAALDDGVTAKSIDIGYIFSKTGVAGSTFLNADKGCQARIDRQNAAGGVNGRKINVEMVDDQSGGANKTAAQDLVQNKHVFMIVNNSSFAFLTYRFLLDDGRPAGRRRLRRHLLRRAGQREHHLRARATWSPPTASPTTACRSS